MQAPQAPKRFVSDDVDYQSLITLLSSKDYLPSTIYTRNTFLRPFLSVPILPAFTEERTEEIGLDFSTIDKPVSSSDYWQLFTHPRNGASSAGQDLQDQIFFFGDVPQDILTNSGKAKIKAPSGGRSSLWALLTFGKLPDATSTTGGLRWRAHLWFSSERQLFAASDEPSTPQLEDLFAATSALFFYILDEVIRPILNDDNSNHVFFHELNTRLSELVSKQITKYKVPYEGPCGVFALPSSAISEPDDGILDRPPRKIIRRLNMQDAPLVKSKNKIPFNDAYIEKRLGFASVAVCVEETGEVAGFCFLHDALALGALHILPAYRHQGLAKLIIDKLAIAAVAYQKAALGSLQVSPVEEKHLEDPHTATWVYATSETSNPDAWSFFKKCGYELIALNSYTAVEFIDQA